MRIRSLIGSCVVALALAVPSLAQAQTPNKPVSGGDDSNVLVGAGLTFLTCCGSTGIGVAGNVLFNTLKTTGNGRIGIVGDLGLNHFDGGTTTTLMGGGRYTFTTSGKIIPYGQLLLGIVHCCGNTEFDPNLGFGMDVAWKDNLNFRAEISFIFTTETSTRFFFGVSLPMKK